ncbi:hypothetical protein [Arcanobacterium canis]
MFKNKSTKYITYSAFTSFSLGIFSAINILYLSWIGMSWAQIGYLVAAFNIAVLIFEVPSSIITDMWSARGTLFIGLISRILGLTIFGIADTFLWLLIAQLLTGFGFAFVSGNFDKLLLGELKLRTEASITQMNSKIQRISLAITAISAAIGVILYAFSPRIVWFLAALSMLAALLISASFSSAHSAPPTSVRHLFRSVLPALSHRSFWISVLTASSAVAPLTIWQNIFGSKQLIIIGILGCAIGIVGTISAHITFKYAHNAPLTAVIFMNIICISLFSLCTTYIGAIFFLLHVALQTHMSIRAYGIFHANTNDSIRATVTSLASLGDSALVAIASIAVGYVTQFAGFFAASLISSAIIVILWAVLAFGKKTATETSL